MIVQVRAPMGAGKSTLVQRLLRDHGGEVVDERTFVRVTKAGTPDEKQKPEKMKLWRCEAGLHVLGSYANLTDVSRGSGADKLNGSVALEMFDYYTGLGLPHLLWESARGSMEFPKDPLLSRERELGVVWATLDTPADECIRRIYKRRQERETKVGAPLNESSVRGQRKSVDRAAEWGAESGIRQAVLRWNQEPYQQLHDLLMWGGWTCSHRSQPPKWDWEAVFGPVTQIVGD